MMPSNPAPCATAGSRRPDGLLSISLAGLPVQVRQMLAQQDPLPVGLDLVERVDLAKFQQCLDLARGVGTGHLSLP